MTTNHIELLDKALIRPGRVNIKIELSNMKKNEIKEMLINFYGNKKDIDLLSEIMNNKYTPSEIENSCKNLNFEEFSKKYVL